MSDSSGLRQVVRVLVLIGLVALTSSSVLAAAPAAPPVAQTTEAPSAHWVERKFDYTYQGFTAKYSCDGLSSTVREVLLALGARKDDLKLQTRGCTHLEGPEPFPGVSVRFSVLVPVTPDEIGKVGDAKAQATQWKNVDLVRLTRYGVEQAPCELLEQLKDKALPLFTSRNLQFRASCVPNQVSPGEIQFSVDVLRVAPAPAPASGVVAPTA